MAPCNHPPKPRCRLCQLAGRVPFPADMPRGANCSAVPLSPPTVPLPCEFVGSAVRGPAAPDLTRDWRECTHALQPLGPVVCACKGCGPSCRGYVPEGGSAPAKQFTWVSTARLAADAHRLAGILPPNASGVAGIPRSGMTPASIVAAALQLPLFELTEEGRLNRLGHGSRGRNLGFAGDPTGPLVVVDDTVYGGGAMRRARRFAPKGSILAAVYCRPESRRWVDLAAVDLPAPHLLEWNVGNNGVWAGFAADPSYGSGIACDFDGILCADPDVPDADEAGYLDFLRAARPKLLPRRHPCRLIVTGRLERWRAETEGWLRKWGVRWDRLVMHPAATATERDRAGDVASLKAAEFKASRCGFFLESDPRQAEAIFRLSGKPVICPAADKVWQ